MHFQLALLALLLLFTLTSSSSGSYQGMTGIHLKFGVFHVSSISFLLAFRNYVHLNYIQIRIRPTISWFGFANPMEIIQ